MEGDKEVLWRKRLRNCEIGKLSLAIPDKCSKREYIKYIKSLAIGTVQSHYLKSLQ